MASGGDHATLARSSGLRSSIPASLPPELLVEVFSYLPPVPDIVRIQRVCREWQDAASDPHLFLTVFLTAVKHCTSFALTHLLERGLLRDTKYLTLGKKGMSSAAMMGLCSSCSELRSITLGGSHLTLPMLDSLKKTSPCLQMISFDDSMRVNNAIAAAAIAVPAMEAIHLARCSWLTAKLFHGLDSVRGSLPLATQGHAASTAHLHSPHSL